MSLIPDEAKQGSQPSPARKLHKKFLRTSTLPRCSRQTHFTDLLKRVPYDEIDSVLTWLAKQPPNVRQLTSSLFAKQFDELLGKKRADLADYPVSPMARQLADVIDQKAERVEPEFVQHAIDNYEKFLEFLREQPEEIAKVVYDQLPPPKDFVALWFGKIVPAYSPKFRKFDVMHPKFQQLILKLSEGQPRAILKVVIRYNEKYQALVDKRLDIK